MSERRRFLKMAVAAPAGALLVPLFGKTGREALAACGACCTSPVGSLPKNIVFSAADEGVWQGKAGSHVPEVRVERAGGKLVVRVETQHGMSEGHYIVRHTVVGECGKVFGAKTFQWKDEPVSEYEIKLPENCKHLFVTSFCSLHDLWIARVKVDA